MKKIFFGGVLLAVSLVFASCNLQFASISKDSGNSSEPDSPSASEEDSDFSQSQSGSFDTQKYDSISVAYRSESSSSYSLRLKDENASSVQVPVLVGVTSDGDIEEIAFKDTKNDDISMDNVKVFTPLTDVYSFLAVSTQSKAADFNSSSTSLYTSGIVNERNYIVNKATGKLFNLEGCFKAIVRQICEDNSCEYSDEILSDSKYYYDSEDEADFDGLVRNQLIIRDDGVYFMAYLNLANPEMLKKSSSDITSKSVYIYKLVFASDSISFDLYDEHTIGDGKIVVFANKTLKNDIYIAVDSDDRRIYSIADKKDRPYDEEVTKYPVMVGIENGIFSLLPFNKIYHEGVNYNFQDLFCGHWPLTPSTANDEMKKAYEFEPMAIGPNNIRYFALFYDNKETMAKSGDSKSVTATNPETDYYADDEEHFNWRRNCYYGSNFLCAPSAIVALDTSGKIVEVKKFGNNYRVMGAVASSVVYGIEVEGAKDCYYRTKEINNPFTGEIVNAPDLQDWETSGIPENAKETLKIYYPAKYGLAEDKVITIDLNESIYERYDINPRDYRLFVDSALALENIDGQCVLTISKLQSDENENKPVVVALQRFKASLDGTISEFVESNSKYKLLGLHPVKK